MNRRILDLSSTEKINIPTSLGIRDIESYASYAVRNCEFLYYVNTILKEIPEIKGVEEIKREKRIKKEERGNWIYEYQVYNIWYKNGLNLKIDIDTGSRWDPQHIFDVSLLFGDADKKDIKRKFSLDMNGNFDEIEQK